jgi:DNA invertase Pin-like site-specific DNA recombinase
MAPRSKDKRDRGKTDPQRVIGYVRVSSDDQQLGPDAQRVALEQWCAAHGGQLVLTCTDRGVSGGAALDQRPGLLAALAALKQHNAGILLVARRDRLARDTLIAALVEQHAQQLGAAIRAVDGSGNTDTPEGVLLRRIVDAFAEYERLTIQARTKAALALKRSRRERISREPPYGWRLSSDGKHIELEPREQATVALAQKLRRSGMSLRRIGYRLAQRGYTPRSAKRWHPQTITSITKGSGEWSLQHTTG